MDWLPAHKSLLEYVQLFVDIAFNLTAIVGVGVAIAALSINRHIQREALARGAYLDYGRLCIDNPNLAFPKLLKMNFNDESAEGSREIFEKYEWFVSTLLMTAKFIFETSGRDRRLREIMVMQLAYHWRYLEHFRDKRHYLTRWNTELSAEFDEAIELGRGKF
jgi:hypothetical protein